MEKGKKIAAAFETWQNGGLQCSSLYLGKSAEAFVERHEESGTFAALHFFYNKEEGIAEYDAAQEDVDWWQS